MTSVLSIPTYVSRQEQALIVSENNRLFPLVPVQADAKTGSNCNTKLIWFLCSNYYAWLLLLDDAYDDSP